MKSRAFYAYCAFSRRFPQVGPLLAKGEGGNYENKDVGVVIPNHIPTRKENMLGTVLVVLLILMLLGALPTWPHSRNWGYYPSGGLGLVLAILVVLVLLGRV